jgi:hypothetical protein
MKRFTVKDFVEANAPCFSCDSDINVRLVVIGPEDDGIFLKLNVLTTYFSVELRNTWDTRLHLTIDYKTNKFATNDILRLREYLEKEDRDIYLQVQCDMCGSYVESEYLGFNWSKSFIKPTEIGEEWTRIMDDKNVYVVLSHHHKNASYISISRIGDFTNPPVKIDAPLLPRYRFKHRNYLVNKLKTYLTFS